MRDFHDSGTPWIPSGLGSRLWWGPPLQSAAVLSVRHCRGVIDHAADDLTITVQAGIPVAELQAVLAEHNQWLPIDWPWGTTPEEASSCGSLGGLVARGLAGGLRHRHLGVRDQIIGIGLLRSDGIEAHAGGRVVKNVAGYDLMRLLCGSWGSLALITELTLRVQPIRPARALLQLDGPLDALDAWRAAVMASSLTPELLTWQKQGDQAPRLQVGVASVSDAAVQDQIERLGALAATHQLRRERSAWQEPWPAAVGRPSTAGWLLRLSLQPTQVRPLLNSREAMALNSWHWQLAAGAGSGDCWSPAGDTGASRSAQVQALRQRVQALGGHLSVLQQPQGGAQALPAWLDAPSRPLIMAVKRQFDPKQQLSRGRLPGVSHPLG